MHVFKDNRLKHFSRHCKFQRRKNLPHYPRSQSPSPWHLRLSQPPTSDSHLGDYSLSPTPYHSGPWVRHPKCRRALFPPSLPMASEPWALLPRCLPKHEYSLQTLLSWIHHPQRPTPLSKLSMVSDHFPVNATQGDQTGRRFEFNCHKSIPNILQPLVLMIQSCHCPLLGHGHYSASIVWLMMMLLPLTLPAIRIVHHPLVPQL